MNRENATLMAESDIKDLYNETARQIHGIIKQEQYQKVLGNLEELMCYKLYVNSPDRVALPKFNEQLFGAILDKVPILAKLNKMRDKAPEVLKKVGTLLKKVATQIDPEILFQAYQSKAIQLMILKDDEKCNNAGVLATISAHLTLGDDKLVKGLILQQLKEIRDDA
jgi:hypothetical protein